ncbi:spherulin-2A-like [Ostrinia furnacalis]|uniref:spherulin-2A-like n=1 Tax=Ostrinia furnacalis TaxID=93504 RepID=UPI00103B65B7|nr:spherulin-2A-like [Ostrinia furnacalis]
MWFKFLLVLPALASAKINVDVVATSDSATSKVEYFGSSIELITDEDIRTFGLTDSKLKDAAQKFSGGRPGDVYLKSPTPWNDLYKSFGWSQVQRTLHPKSARILGIRSEPVLLVTSEFINNSSVTSTYNAGVTQQVEETVSTTWSVGGEMKVEQEINYKVDIGVGEIGGATRFSFSASFGKDTTKSKSVTVGSSQGVQVQLAPGQAVVASLQATRGSMEIQVDYSASLDGDIACNYPGKFKGHYFWRYDLIAVQRASGMKTTVDSTEIIKVGFYFNARVVVSDKVTANTLNIYSAAIKKE